MKTVSELREGLRRRDEGVDRILNVDSGDRQRAIAAINNEIEYLAALGIDFTAEDVREELPDDVLEHLAKHSNLLPACFSGARKRGVIATTGAFAIATRASRHGNPLRVWKGAAA